MAKKEAAPKFAGVFDRFAPLFFIAIVGLAFLVGSLWQKVTLLEEGKGATAVAGDTSNIPQAAPKPADTKLSDEDAKNLVPVSDSDHIRGSSAAEIVLIEYSDYECPYCNQFHPAMLKVVSEYKDRVSWVFRHFPLTFHPKAEPGARASECVAELGGNDAFWEFTDAVFTDQANAISDYGKVAGSIGVNAASFKTCFDSGRYADEVKDSTDAGAKAGVNGTPATFVVNKKGEVWLIPGAYDFEFVKGVIEEALKS